jgi:AcrR family transcriptional regulator
LTEYHRYLNTLGMSERTAARRAPTRAQRQAQTREELLAAAERLFVGRGFHATSLDAVADTAGYTKGAVYSNWSSKEDLFFAVYEQRVDRFLPRLRAALDGVGDAREALLAVLATHRSEQDQEADHWLAVFLEFWTHVLRHPEHRARFAAVHMRYVDELAAGMERCVAESGAVLPFDVRRLTVAVATMTTGIGLERLTQPDLIDASFAVDVQRYLIDSLIIQSGGTLRETP